MPSEVLLAGRDQRVAVGELREVVDVKLGEPWPDDFAGRVDVMIRTGHVIRFENGEPDPRSAQFVRRLGLPAPTSYPSRSWAARARLLEQCETIAGQRVLIFSGKPDGPRGGVFVAGGRAYGLMQGRPDGAAARSAPESVVGGVAPGAARRSANTGGKRRRKKTPRKG